MIELTLEDFKYFLEKQALLDEAIMKEKQITKNEWLNDLENNHVIALKVEVAEFVNECSNIWKYWKDKEPNRERIIDEAIDVLHFVFLRLNKRANLSEKEVYDFYINNSASRINAVGENEKTSEMFRLLLDKQYPLTILAIVMYVLSEYGFTRDDVIEQYNKKNAINFERLENGY